MKVSLTIPRRALALDWWARYWIAIAIRLAVPWQARRYFRPRYWPVPVRYRLRLLTEAEQTKYELARREAGELRAMRGQLQKLSGEYRRLLINALTRAGAAYRRKDGREVVISRIRFMGAVRASPEALWYQVNTGRLPWEVLISFLSDPEVVRTVSFACRRVVRVIADDPEKGLWYVVELRQGVHGVPRMVEFAKVYAAMKEDAPPLTIPVGVGEAGKYYYRDIREMPHALVGGATNMGKSVWLKQALTTLILRNKPERLRMILVDLKRTELPQFSGIPHLILPIIREPADVLAALDHAIREMRHRLEMFERRQVVDIGGYNQRARPILPYWLLVIDEIANIMLDHKLGKEADHRLDELARQSRAAGIHLIIATQRPSVDVVTGLIKANFPVRLAFSTASQADSRVIMDQNDAAQLPHPGRMFFVMGATKVELQGPFISPAVVADTVSEITEGKQAEAADKRRRHNYAEADFFRHALTHYGGRFPLQKIWLDFRAHGVGRDELRQIAEAHDGKEIEIDDKLYRLEKRDDHGQKLARQLVELQITPIDGDPERTDSEINQLTSEPAEAAVAPEHGAMAESDPAPKNGDAGPDLADFQPIPAPITPTPEQAA
jgi:hypothetical protein